MDSVILKPLVRSREWNVSRSIKQALEQRLGIIGLVVIYEPKLSLLLDPRHPTVEQEIVDTGVNFVLLVPRSKVPKKYRLSTPNSELLAAAVILLKEREPKDFHRRTIEIAQRFGLPCAYISSFASESAIAEACEAITWAAIEGFHAGWARWRRNAVNTWHYDMLMEVSARAAEVGLHCVAEPALDAVVDLAIARNAGLIERPYDRFFRQTTLDIVITTRGPFCIPVTVVHIDGRHHDEPAQREKDAACDALLEKAGLLTCRARLDVVNGGRASRENGVGHPIYLERVADLASVLAATSLDLNNSTRQKALTTSFLRHSIQRVARRDPLLADDLLYLLDRYDQAFAVAEMEARNMSTEDHLSACIGEAHQFGPSHEEMFDMFDLGETENRVNALASRRPDAALDAMALEFSVTADREHKLSLGVKTGELPIVTVARPWPAVLEFQGASAEAAQQRFEERIRTHLRHDALEEVSELMSKDPSFLQSLQQNLAFVKETILVREWNRMSAAQRERKICTELRLQEFWATSTRRQQQASREEFLQEFLATPDLISDEQLRGLGKHEIARLRERLSERRQQLEVLVLRSDATSDEKGYLALLVDDSFSTEMQRLLGAADA
jgi:hypothetical protein